MPQAIDPEALYEHHEHFNEKNYLSELLIDQFYAPMQTQENLESNLAAIRQAYRMAQMDDIFVANFIRIHDFLDKYEETAAYRCPMVMNFPYTKEDFLSTDMPFREIAEQKDSFKMEQTRTRIQKQAEKVGIRNFSKLWQEYEKAHKLAVMNDSRYGVEIATDCGTVRLQTGDWKFDDTGIWRNAGNGFEYACSHKIAPVRRLINLDTGMTKLMIAFERGGRLRYLIRDKRDLFDSRKIIELSSADVAVTSKTAANLSQFLCEIESRNYDAIPEQDSVGRLGWLENGLFSPFMKDVAFDGDAAFGKIFSAMHESGDYETWLQCSVGCRKFSITAQIMLAASFASVLLSKIGGLPFFVHLWGVDSETGKTVALMLAASVWGDPQVGRYVQTFRSTKVGHEYTANFLKNIPMCIDEKQLDSKFDVYQLAEGSGKTRGNKSGGIAETPTWNLAILTTGETPLNNAGAGAGALNRVIDIECRTEHKVIADGVATAKTLLKNYGFAGKSFLAQLTPELLAEAEELHEKYYRQLQILDKTDKQSAPASLILTADYLADKLIFKTGNVLTPEKIVDFLKSKSEVSAGVRGYDYLCDWVALNTAKFSGENPGDVYGVIEGDFAYINRTAFRKACADGGYNETAVLSWLKSKNLIQTRGRAMTKSKRIAGVRVECVVMQLPFGEPEENPLDELL